jgi:hypothetical protein
MIDKTENTNLIINDMYSGYFYFLSFIFVKENNKYIINLISSLFLLFQTRILVFLNNFYHYFKSKNEKSDFDYNSTREKVVINYEDKYKNKYLLLEDKEFNKEQLDELKNNIILENTPLGNVIMFYDNRRETFTYYSDSTMPYRFLETVARKYVVLHNCKQIFVNMDDEINLAEKKLKEKKQKKTEEEEKRNKQKELNESVPIKRNVFAKLKSYNKDNGLKAAGIPSDKKTSSTEVNEENMILKENANRYSCEGKINNFSLLKKVERKIVDKRYGMSFAEFKKIQNTKN